MAVQPLDIMPVYAKIEDVSTAGQVYVVAPTDGEIVKVYSALNAAIAMANAAITTKIAGTAITGGGITITQSGSAAGDVDSAEPTAANYVKEGQVIEIETDGASTNTVSVDFTILISRARS